ncbi:MAG: hypothetical protein B7Z80_02675 [Rhodospirillales bacterium 20-64-7]|nr:MAG: hypothetical protein B7Z80_02675 [Rhodospirillales bacterium 20-64-7]
MYTGKMALDSRICDRIPITNAAIKNVDAFGIEVELEGTDVANMTPLVAEYWAPHQDHSLRAHNGGQAIEYVFHKPYPMDKTRLAVDVLYDFLSDPKIIVKDSYRTSIHVHVNLAANTFRTVYNFIALSLILDELLVSQNGDHRVGNNFCLRAKDAYGQVQSLINSIQASNDVFRVSQNERYSSINFASLSKFGSVEFRSLECTTDKARLVHWINTLQKIKDSASLYKNPVEVIGEFSKMGPQQFLLKVLGPYAIKYISVPGYEDMLKTGMRIAQDFAYCSAWNVRELPKEGEMEVKPKKAKPLKYAPPQNYGVMPAGGFQAVYGQWDIEAAPQVAIQAPPPYDGEVIQVQPDHGAAFWNEFAEPNDE